VILLRLKLAQKFSESGYDITPEEWVILNRLWQKEGRSQNELAETTIKDKTTVTRLLNRMENKGLVVRQSSNEDARVKLVNLTPYAKELETVLIPIAKELLSAGVADIDKGDVDIALSVLKKIERNLLRFE
jgi:DNA-binding MarR family transcriptional regulator